jgi:nucleotide-binding universal stress UspA family protein
MSQRAQSVVVGVTGAEENTDALRYAIAEARARGGGITLVHAVHPPLPPSPPHPLAIDDTWREIGDHIVRDVRRELGQLLGDEEMPVATEVHVGSRAAVLSEASKDALMVVLQHRDYSSLHRIFTGSTVASVATHAHSPVVSVPPASSDRAPVGMIAVGVRSDGGPREVLDAAFAEASARTSGVRVVHGWKVPAAYEGIGAQWTTQDHERLTAAVTDLHKKYPDIDVRLEVQNHWPANVLVQAAADADLLVVGRHEGFAMMPPRFGSLARSAVAHSSCPVMVVPV